MRKTFFFLLSCIPWFWLANAADAPRPNLIIMMADDMGYSDIGCFGGEIQTPTLNSLAKTGVRFTQFYNTARCCPTRASLLTGLYPHQAGVGHMTDDKGFDAYRGDLNRRCVTIAEVLRPAGYRTYMTGKWHVTKQVKPDGSKDNWPLQRGFDRFYGTIMGGGSFFDPATLTLDNTQIPAGGDFYYTDAIADHAAQFISEHGTQHGGKPFFLYVAFTAPHWPMHAKPQDIAKHKGRYDQGWDALREERNRRQIAMGLVKKEWTLTPRDEKAPAWSDAENKEWFARRMEVYAAMVDCLDQGVGRIVAALRRSGQFENTLVMFLSDNGGCAEEMGSAGTVHAVATKESPLKPMAKDELQTALVPYKTRDGRPVRQGAGVMPGPADTYLAYGLPWANVSNTPFRLYKHWEHEGGISSPFIAHWPRGIPASRHNQFERQPAHLIDLMATCVDLSGATYPAEFDGQRVQPREGVSLAPAFAGQPLARTAPIFWEHEGNRAVRDGQWKLVSKHPGPWELYDMEADRTELHDLAAQHSDRVKAMSAQWDAWAKRCGVQPWPVGGEKAKAKAKKGKRKS